MTPADKRDILFWSGFPLTSGFPRSLEHSKNIWELRAAISRHLISPSRKGVSTGFLLVCEPVLAGEITVTHSGLSSPPHKPWVQQVSVRSHFSLGPVLLPECGLSCARCKPILLQLLFPGLNATKRVHLSYLVESFLFV